MSSTIVRPFWCALNVYICRPNLINKRVMGTKQLHCWPLTNFSFDNYESIRDSSLQQLRHKFSGSDEYVLDLISDIESIIGCFIIVRQLYPKLSLKHLSQYDNSCLDFEYIILNISKCCAIFMPKMAANSKTVATCDYKVYLNGNQQIGIDLLGESETNYWLIETVLPKLRHWFRQELDGHVTHSSLNLISVEEYCQTYNLLKLRYASKLVEMWPQTETTDPIKYVFEDIAIASYLIVLWSKGSEDSGSQTKQSFVDFGCGNGLLVYLLVSEGYNGIGIDIRKRKIWDNYDIKLNLIEKTFTPSDNSLIFPDYDWIIGNHSDELTPWIPYIAAQSSYSTKCFLLPCCPFDFNGRKYQRLNSRVSQYNCFMTYIKHICEMMGFNTKLDKLRIPSTKRICIVCDSRNYELCFENDLILQRKQFTNQKLNNFLSYKPREKVEPIRNCTNISKNIIQEMVNFIANSLLNAENKLEISEIAKLLSNEMRIHLKNQCGGLQTLLRNHKHIFEAKNGFIYLCQPKVIEDGITRHNKTKNCWFFHNHPNGCPLTSEQCVFIH